MEKVITEAVKSCINRGTGIGSSAKVTPERWVHSICGYCSAGCGIYIGIRDGQAVAVQGNTNSPVNKGHLCIKGIYEWKTLHHPQRATTPMIRKNGQLVPASWDEALNLLTEKLRENLKDFGPTSVGIYHTGQFLLEEYYALGKFAKGFLGTPNIDSNTRLCMAAAIYGYIRTFGTDGPPGCYEDLDVADLLFIFGANPAEMHPQLWQRIINNKKKRGAKIIVADPRYTLPAQVADIHLALRPGTNVSLLNSIAYVLLEENLIDPEYIEKNCAGFSEFKALVSQYSPEKAAKITGIPAEKIREAALLFGRSSTATTVYSQGVNQSMSAADTVTLINNLHLLTGKIGKPGSSPFSLTGQTTAMSSREVGGTAFLPGFRNPKNPAHRAEVANFWGINPSNLPTETNDIMKMMGLIEKGEQKFLWTMGTNPAVSLPDQGYVRELLDKVFLVVQDIYYPMETAAYADIFLPAAQWGEKTGTYTNSERRVNVGCKAVEPPGEGKADFDILLDVAKRLGAEELFPWQNTEDAFEEWKLLSKGRPNDMSGMTYQRLVKEGGLRWPCSTESHSGEARLYTDGIFNTHPEFSQDYGTFNNEENRAKLWAVEYQEPPEVPDEEYPFWLNTGRMIEHFHTRTKTKRIPELNCLAEEGFVEVNSVDAEKLGIADGEKVRITSRRGWIEVKAFVKNTVSQGQLFIPFHFGDLDPEERHLKQAVNHLTLNWVDPISKQPIFKIAACKIEKI